MPPKLTIVSAEPANGQFNRPPAYQGANLPPFIQALAHSTQIISYREPLSYDGMQ